MTACIKVQTDDGRLVPLSPEEFRTQFGVTYTRQLVYAPGFKPTPPGEPRPRQMPSDERRPVIQRALARTLVRGESDKFDRLSLCWLFADDIRAAHIADVYLAKISDTIGHGLFAGADMEPGTFIAEYAGLLRKDRYDEDRDNAYLFSYWFPLGCIDASEQGNETRFINHSVQHANCHPVYVAVDGVMHVGFATMRDIARGEQLLFNYGEGYWQLRGYAPIDL